MSAKKNDSQIRAAREAIGWSMGELARRAGVSQPTVANWERREQAGRITLATLERAAEVLGADFSYSIELGRKTPPVRKEKPIATPRRHAAIKRNVAPTRTDPNAIWL